MNSKNSDCVVASVSVSVESGNGGEGGGPSGSQELGGPPSVTQPPTAGVAVGVVADGVVRACQALESPEVPHLPVPSPGGAARGAFLSDVPNSPLHSALQFNHFTPNPSAPSPQSPSFALPPPSHVHVGVSYCASVVFCFSSGAECGPEVETSYGKCQRCLDISFHTFARTHCPTRVAQYNSSPSFEGTAALADPALRDETGQPLPKRPRVASPPRRKAGPPSLNLSPSIEGTAASAVAGQSSPKRLRVEPPPHRKAGPPN